MARMVAILEDDSARVALMQACLTNHVPQVEPVFFESAAEMISWLRDHLVDVVLISLDHDLPLKDANGVRVDYGTGRQVADFLASVPPTCPVIVHSSNADCAAGMIFTLNDAGWPHERVYPHDDLEWVRQDWSSLVVRCFRDGWVNL